MLTKEEYELLQASAKSQHELIQILASILRKNLDGWNLDTLTSTITLTIEESHNLDMILGEVVAERTAIFGEELPRG